MEESRKQFEEWYLLSNKCEALFKDIRGEYAYLNTWCSWQAWQASRAAIEIQLGPYLNPLMFNEDVLFGYHKAKGEALNSIRAAGLKIKGE